MVERLVEIQILLNTEAGEEYGDQVAYRIGVHLRLLSAHVPHHEFTKRLPAFKDHVADFARQAFQSFQFAH